MTTLVYSIASLTLLLCSAAQLEAGSATWALSPTSGDWNTAANWTPNTIPNSASDIATFGQSAVTSLSINMTSVSVDSIVYEAGASPYTITTVDANLSLYGSGIVNNSGIAQSLNMGANLIMLFYNSATAGEMTSFGGPGGQFDFNDSSSAGSANFDVISGQGIQAQLNFFDSTTAANATITVTSAVVDFFDYSTASNAVITVKMGGGILFDDVSTADRIAVAVSSEGAEFIGSGIGFRGSATAANGTFNADGATSSTGFASYVTFIGVSTAGNATFVLNGGSADGAAGAVMNLYDTANANKATITVNGGANGGAGASVIFNIGSRGGTARFVLNGNGTLDISNHNSNLVTIGSLGGNGVVFLGARQLAVGSASSSTTFSGSIQDGSNGSGGSFSKVGKGTLTLTGASTYTGTTTISAGTLQVSNNSGSGTGMGAVNVNAGTLSGKGILAGPVTVGTGSGVGAFLTPSAGMNVQVTLTIQGPLTFNSDATYTYKLNEKNASSDQVISQGVTIKSGAQFKFTPVANKRLRVGSVFTVINNSSGLPISGVFANLPDGATITSGHNSFQVSYEGGSGNDLTLTVLP